MTEPLTPNYIKRTKGMDLSEEQKQEILEFFERKQKDD